MTTLHYTAKFHKTVLASFIGLVISQSCFALEAMSDEKLSDTTGEGIALLPQDAYMVFRGVGVNETQSQLLDRTKDIGYINYIPVGPLSLDAADTNNNNQIDSSDLVVGKADLYLYGLALSKANDADPDDYNERVGMLKNTAGVATAINSIKSWGTATNPWILKVDTDQTVPTFTPDIVNGAKNTDTGKVTYLSLEAPAFETGALDVDGSDAYKLKLGVWADAFVRNPNRKDGDANQFQYGTSTGTRGNGLEISNRENRIRLQAIWNNFSLNGSRIQLFQTLNGSSNTGGMSPFYNNTLGLAGAIRLNSGDAANLKLKTTDIASENMSAITTNTIHAGANSTLSTSASGDCGNSGTGAISNGSSAGCQYIVQKRSRTDTKALTRSWDLPAEYKNRVLRLSTQETTDTNLLYTPALDISGNAKAPTFAKNEGIFIYNLNANLILGSLYQPLILGSDGKNFSLEIARIPNKESIYKKIYTDYTGSDSTYLGSTCNVYQCGNNGIAGYQGNSATHSSISIGSVYSDDGGKTLKAYMGADAVGVSFGNLVQSNTVTNTLTTNEIRYLQRQLQSQTWLQNSRCSTTGLFGCSNVTSTYGTLTQWQYNNGSNWVDSLSGSQTKPNDASACGTGFGASNSCNNFPNPNPNTTVITATTANRTWSDTNRNGAEWRTSPNTTVDNFIGAGNGVTGAAILNNNMAQTPNISGTPMNNLGSAVIDGMLIQHMKITTKGL
ncbi:MAG: hypothetical protein GAK29_03673 [Acinetobacter bereziniae]|uniref:Uncharacterized protein n=1 Tax=Acinetobacter bereziniae TaxID=106648 RepID=A0A833UKT9_ACIBZ|nr:MAG: hypothetical protein GAK29_03673 [Acinetobacter bereziniae]